MGPSSNRARRLSSGETAQQQLNRAANEQRKRPVKENKSEGAEGDDLQMSW